jgi:hypothetical protein
MERTCARAVELGFPAVAFTEHADHTAWRVLANDLDQHPHLEAFVIGGPAGGAVQPPPLDLDGYMSCVQRCRDRFPDLQIITGVELGEPHWHRDAVARLLEAGRFDRVLGSCTAFRMGTSSRRCPTCSATGRLRRWSVTTGGADRAAGGPRRVHRVGARRLPAALLAGSGRTVRRAHVGGRVPARPARARRKRPDDGGEHPRPAASGPGPLVARRRG